MAFKHYPVLTLAGGAQRLSALLQAVAGVDPGATVGAAGAVGGADDVGWRQLFLQPDGGNANPIYVGGSASVDSNNHAFRMEKGNATIPPAPTEIGSFEGSGLKVSDIWINGTAGEKLHVGGVPA